MVNGLFGFIIGFVICFGILSVAFKGATFIKGNEDDGFFVEHKEVVYRLVKVE